MFEQDQARAETGAGFFVTLVGRAPVPWGRLCSWGPRDWTPPRSGFSVRFVDRFACIKPGGAAVNK